MEINKKQLIEQLRYLAANDPKGFKEIMDALLTGQNSVEEGQFEYLTEEELKEKKIQDIRAKNFKRFEAVYKALS